MEMNHVFAPGCALMLYKPDLAEKINAILNCHPGKMDTLLTCCRHDPHFKTKTEVINICPGCDKRYRSIYENTTTVSLWEILAKNDSFPFPDYHGKKMTIMDACPVREQEQIHHSIRILLDKMNIQLVEPAKTRSNSVCCGDSFFGAIPIEGVKNQMIKRTSEMPSDDVVVYCVSCIKSIFTGGKKPHYLVDLLFGEETHPKTFEPDEWHRELDDYINHH